MECFKTFELSFHGNVPSGSQADVDVTAKFTNDSECVTVKGFYDGDGIYKVRFLPRKTGTWYWEVKGMVNANGSEVCICSEKYHGLVQAEGTHFTFEDGAKYLPFGTTVYALAHQTDEVIRDTFETLKNAPFNKVRMCVFPKHYDLVKSEPSLYPFEQDAAGKWDVHRPSFDFWHRLEWCIDTLEALDIQTDLILFHPYDRWGFSCMTMDDNLVYLDTVLRRLAARPHVWWSMANEYDLMDGWAIDDWYRIEAFVTANDPYSHLLSNHNCMATYDYSRPNITHVCIQTTWVENAASWIAEYSKPVIYDEMRYEGNLIFEWGNISGFELVHRFWAVCSVGAYATHGDTFMDKNDIIWWACGGKLKGQSASRIKFLKDILYSLPGPLVPSEQRGLRRIENMQGPDAGQDESLPQPMMESFRRMDLGLRTALMNQSTKFDGHCDEDVYLTYLGRTCPYKTDLRLPEGQRYTVQVIDIWEMTKTTVLTGAYGAVEVLLPAKEGIAVLAVKE